MIRRVLMWIIGLILLASIIFMVYRLINTRGKELTLNEIPQNFVDISELVDGEVSDECVNEWAEYNQHIGKEIEEAGNNLAEDDTHYLLKDVLGYIEVYYLENNEEFLYKKTTIPTAYLSQEDIEDLKIGIEVTGIDSLNKMLEDFE